MILQLANPSLLNVYHLLHLYLCFFNVFFTSQNRKYSNANIKEFLRWILLGFLYVFCIILNSLCAKYYWGANDANSMKKAIENILAFCHQNKQDLYTRRWWLNSELTNPMILSLVPFSIEMKSLESLWCLNELVWTITASWNRQINQVS